MVYLIWELYDGVNHREECAEVLATAYMVTITIKSSITTL